MSSLSLIYTVLGCSFSIISIICSSKSFLEINSGSKGLNQEIYLILTLALKFARVHS